MKRSILLLLSSIGLYGQWITGFYSAQNGVLPISSIPWDKYTHIIHFAAAPNSDGTVDLHYLTQDEISSITASRPAGKNVIVALKDNDSNSNAFRAATSPETIATFANNIANFVNSNGYDGVDIDWEANIDIAQFQDLIKRLRDAMPTKVIAMDAGNWGGLETVAAGAASSLDQVNVMCYDMDNPSNGYSWFNDALLQNGDANLATCDWRVRSLTDAGLPASKIGIGIPYYGRRWSGVSQPLVSGSVNTSWFPYRNLVTDGSRWKPQYQFYDAAHKANYLSIPGFLGLLNEFDSYNGVEFIQDAVAWQQAQGFGGFMTFTLEYEYLANQSGDARYPLSTALAAAVGAGTTANIPAPSIPSPTSPTVDLGIFPLSIAPLAGSASSQAFTFQLFGPSESSDVQQLDAVFGTAVGQANSCRVQFWAPTNTLFLQSDDTTSWAQAALGSSTILRNSQCSINPAASSVSGAGTGWSATFAMAFSPDYAGAKTTFAFVGGASWNSGWATVGTWTVPAVVVTESPLLVYVTPNAGSGSSATFTLGITDAGDHSNVMQGALLIGNTIGGAQSCYISYWAPTNTLSLLSDDSTAWSSATVGTSVLLENGQCSVNSALATVAGSGKTMTVSLPVTFTTNYEGARSLYIWGGNKANQNSGWQNNGTWTVNMEMK